MLNCRSRRKCALCCACKGHYHLYPPGTSNDRTVTTSEPVMRGSQGTRGVEGKDGGIHKGAGRTGCRATRRMSSRNRASKALRMGDVDVCGFKELGILPDEVVESSQRSPGVENLQVLP